MIGLGERYFKAVTEDSPIAYWRLGEKSGSTAVDVIAARNGTHGSGVTVGVVGPMEPGARYNGTSNGITNVANNAAFSGWNDFAIEFWVKVIAWPTGTSAGYLIDVYNAVTGVNRGSWGINIRGPSTSNPDTLIAFFSPNGSTSLVGPSIPKASVANSAWHYVAFTRAGTTVTAYLDGNSVSTATVSGALYANAVDALMMGSAPSNAPANVELAECAIYNTALSAARIAAHYAAASVALRTGIRGNVAVRGKVGISNP